jgi:hypothetical protein
LPPGITFFENEAYILEFGESSKSRGPRVIKIDENGKKKIKVFDYEKYQKPIHNDLNVSKELQDKSGSI